MTALLVLLLVQEVKFLLVIREMKDKLNMLLLVQSLKQVQMQLMEANCFPHKMLWEI